jgi:mRNA-degrading endonuclease RelE of RelBE toxin-antitoxin system
MRIARTEHFKRSYTKAPPQIKARVKKALSLLVVDPRKRIWQARVDGGWRLYFQIRRGTYYLLELIPHPH